MIPYRATIASVLPLLLAPIGCGNDSGTGTRATVRDSAGIEVVDYAASVRELPIAFRIDETPRMDLGGQRSDPNEELNPASPFHDALPFPNGRHVVVDNSDLKVFDSEGRHLFTAGRAGDGPGEFRQVLSACPGPDDTIVAIHSSGGRISVFDVSGAHLRTFSVAEGNAPVGNCFEDGSLISVTDWWANPDRPDAKVATASHIAADGTDLGVIASIPAWPAGTFPFPAEASGVVAHGRQMYVGLGLDPEVRVYDLDGTLARIVRWNEPRVAFTDAVLEELVTSGRLGIQVIRPDGPADMFELLRDRPRLDMLPVYKRLKIDTAGRIWVEDHEYTGDSPLPWTVFDPSGQPLGRVYIPRPPGATGRVRLGWIGTDEVVLIWRDEALGFPHVTLHALEAGGPV